MEKGTEQEATADLDNVETGRGPDEVITIDLLGELGLDSDTIELLQRLAGEEEFGVDVKFADGEKEYSIGSLMKQGEDEPDSNPSSATTVRSKAAPVVVGEPIIITVSVIKWHLLRRLYELVKDTSEYNEGQLYVKLPFFRDPMRTKDLIKKVRKYIRKYHYGKEITVEEALVELASQVDGKVLSPDELNAFKERLDILKWH